VLPAERERERKREREREIERKRKREREKERERERERGSRLDEQLVLHDQIREDMNYCCVAGGSGVSKNEEEEQEL
jgi:hypothetical protein